MSGFTINSVQLSGNLTRDPEIKSTAGGMVICSLRIAVNERYKNNDSGQWQDRANYFDVTVFGGMGEWIGKNMSKGNEIAVAGKLRWREWETRDGGKRQSVEVIADSIMAPRGEGRSSGGGNGGGGSRESVGAAASSSDVPFDSSALPGANDDIPF